MPFTFGDSVVQFARTSWIVPPEIYESTLRTIEEYLKSELNAVHVGITVSVPFGSGVALRGEWPLRVWWTQPLKAEGEYTCQIALTHETGKPLWITGKNKDLLGSAGDYEDLLNNVRPQDVPRYLNATFSSESNSRTSIILPLYSVSFFSLTETSAWSFRTKRFSGFLDGSNTVPCDAPSLDVNKNPLSHQSG